jgi:galactonate dehydratase
VKISDIDSVVVNVNHRGDWIFVLVHTDEGLTGLGEVSHGGNDALVLAVLDRFKAELIGNNPLDINRIWLRLAGTDGGRITHTALSGIETALWDIVGQLAALPIHALFGGAARKRIRLYANINRHLRNRSPEKFAEAASQAVGEGFTAVKIAPFDELRDPDHVRTGGSAAWLKGIERVEAVRAAIGGTVELAVDCHGSMDMAEAITVGRALAPFDLLWYEEPVSSGHPGQLATITRQVPMATASGEMLFGLEEFRPFLSERIVDVLMPDVKHCGGLKELCNIAAAARIHRLAIAPHNPSGPVATAASGQVAAALSNFFILEHAWGEVPWRKELLDPTERIENGFLVIEERPGLGCRLEPEVAEAHKG